jgi:uncharacterized secreted protein with C-terminal beta-propeller domain
MSFENRYKKDNDALHLDANARQRIAHVLTEAQHSEQPMVIDTPRRKPRLSMWVPVAATAAACLVLLLLGAQAITLVLGFRAIRSSQNPRYTTQATNATTYADIYHVVSQVPGGHGSGYGGSEADMVWDEGAPLNASESQSESRVDGSADALSAESSRERTDISSKEKEFSKTNTQVEGVDEADIVKTDGDYLYLIAGDRLVIAQADGKDTRVVSDTTIAKSQGRHSRNPLEMFLEKDRLTILFSENEYGSGDPIGILYEEIADVAWYPQQTRTIAVTYDISNPGKPREIARSGQDGNYVTSRMQDGIVYVVTTHYLYAELNPDDPQTFVPSLYDRDEKTPLAPDCIELPQCPADSSYVVITSMSAKTGERIEGKSLFGYTSTVYMSQDSLIIAQSVYNEEIVETSTEGQYTVEHHRNGSSTHLVRFSITKGMMAFEAEGEVTGDLLNQFSIDEYEGHIRLVTTVSGSEYKVYVDEERGFENYEYQDNTTMTNALYVLDSDLDVVGKLTGLAEDERVYSVRFSGDTGYFVTFRQVDPLFAVDLSDPTDPKILSQLKIPGFSQYLHVYDDGLLFGLGMEADEQTGRTTGMKLSMFDTSDPFNVTQRHKLVLDTYYSEALDNHRAILVLPEKDIIAFPAEEGYVVYGYSEKSGFSKRGEMKLSGAYGSRGVMIDDLLYICSVDGIGVFELESFTPICNVRF